MLLLCSMYAAGAALPPWLPAACQVISLLMITHRKHLITKGDRVYSLAAGRWVRCARWLSLRVVRWAKPALSFNTLFYAGNLPFPGASR